MTPLRVGERVRIREDSEPLECVRVTPCAAYLRSFRVRDVEIPAKVDGMGRELEPARSFTARSSELIAVSRRAFVYREEAE